MTATDTDITLLVDAGNKLGEGAVWDEREQALFWVDIEAGRLHRCNASGGDVQHWDFAERLGSFALREQGGLVLALQSGLALFDPGSGALDWLARPEADQPDNRFNEGKCDRAGRFWAGTMSLGLKESTGALYCLHADHTLHTMARGIGIPNSMAWSPDNRTMYFADTLQSVIYAYAFDPAAGTISDRRVFASTQGEAGAPDGSTVDADGFLWNAQWGARRLVRYAPDGRVDRVVPLPVRYPTSCSFGGPGLQTLYVTCAAWDLTSAERAAEPWSGGVLALQPGVRGLPESRFAG